MARIGGGKPFPFKYMPQMAAAPGADDFCPHAVCIGDAEYCPRDGPVKARPAAAGIEFVFRAVKLGPAAAAYIRSLFRMVAKFTGKRRFRGFV